MPYSVFAVSVRPSCTLATGGPKGKTRTELEPVAETKLLMEGLADPNMRALGKLLADKPKDAEAWGFARGQALLMPKPATCC